MKENRTHSLHKIRTLIEIGTYKTIFIEMIKTKGLQGTRGKWNLDSLWLELSCRGLSRELGDDFSNNYKELPSDSTIPNTDIYSSDKGTDLKR